MHTPLPPRLERFASPAPRLVVVTGLSGTGRSTVLHALEDIGYYCVDNLPSRLVPPLLELLATEPSASAGPSVQSPSQGDPIERIALGLDVRTGAFLAGSAEVLEALRNEGYRVEVLFLDAAPEVLVRRYSETRRPHPLGRHGDILAAIERERQRIAFLRAEASWVIDTSELTVHELRRRLIDHFVQGGDQLSMQLRFVSFGFKWGVPIDIDLLFDLRYLPNPHFQPVLRGQSGLDDAVAEYVLCSEEGAEFYEQVLALLQRFLPHYQREGKSYLTVALGCTGGKHRSVAMAEALAEALQERFSVSVTHRDQAHWPR